MHVALIPPLGYESTIFMSRFHMMLPHVEHDGYKQAYKMARGRGDHIMLDNGAAEFVNNFTAKQLVVMAKRDGAAELVAPDHLRNHNKTVSAVAWFLAQVEKMHPDNSDGLDFMAVAQGKNVEEARACILDFVPIERIAILGIPRLLITEAHAAARIDLANWVEESFPERFKIHLLGTSPLWPREVKMAASYAPHIRSVDTSLPYNFAIEGLRLDVQRAPAIRRPDGYFTQQRQVNPGLIKRNIETLLGWANAEAPVS